MSALSGLPIAIDTPATWFLLFAHNAEPDLELDEVSDDLEETVVTKKGAGRPSPKRQPSGSRRPLILMLLLIVLVGGWFAYDPESFMNVIGLGTPAPPPIPDTVKPPAPPTAAQPPAAPAPAPGPAPAAAPPPAPVATAPTPAPAPTPMPVPPPVATAPVPAPTPTAPAPVPTAPPPAPAPAPAPVAPPLPAPVATAPAPAPVPATPSPQFGEGQAVVVVADPSSPAGSVTLTTDSAGAHPGPAVRGGEIVTVLDGELRGSAWVYSVRTSLGAKGWIEERRLKAR